jgi:predicted phage terminase large subunit-like protein
MLNPSSDIVRDFKDAWIKDKYYDWTVPGKELTYRENTGELRYVRVSELDTVMSVDPAISESVRADRTGIIVSGSIDGRHHVILEARAERLGVLDLCKTIEELHRRYRCRRIFVESVAYQKALAQLLAFKGLPIHEVKPGTSKTKEMRIRALEPFFRQGHIYLHPRQFDFFTEYEHFPRGQHDDLLDAMSYLTDEWSRIIGREDSHLQKMEQHDKIQIEKLRRWADGRPSAADRRTGAMVDSSDEHSRVQHRYPVRRGR